MTVSPATTRTRATNLSAELKDLPQWVVFETRPGKGGKLEKRAYTPGTDTLARSNDPATWRAYDVALADAEARDRWLGFCFTPDLPYILLDFDDVLGGQGAVKQYAALVIDTLDSYTEVSAGGTGAHVLVRGALSEGFSKDGIGGKVEVYPVAGGRFCLLTGDTRPGLGSLDGLIEERTEALATFFPPKPKPEPRAHQNGHDATLSAATLSALTAVLAPHRVEGQRHFLDLAIAGLLAKQGVAEEQAQKIVAELSDDERKAANAVRDSYAKLASGSAVAGYRALEELVDAATLATVDTLLRPLWEASQPKIVMPGRTARVKSGANPGGADAEHWPAPPAEAFRGWFGEYLELVEPTTEAPDAFHLGAALTLAGATFGRAVWTEYASERLFANVYTVLIGASGSSRKDTAIKRAMAFRIPPPSVREIPNPPFKVVTDISSSEGLIGTLKETPNTLLYLTELSMLLRNARRKGTSTILPRLIEAWDTPNRLSNLSKGNAQEAIDPYLSIIAATQPGILAAEMTVDDIHSGFANRWLYMVGAGKPPRPTPPALDKHAAWKLYRGLEMQIQQAQRRGVVPAARETEALWHDWYLTKHDPKNEPKNEEIAAMLVRLPVLARKIALIFAVSEGSKAITGEQLLAAIALVEWMWEQTQRLLASWGIGLDSQIEIRIHDVLTRTGPIKKRDLQRKCSNRRWSAADFDRVFRAMQNNQTIGFDEEGRVGLRDD